MRNLNVITYALIVLGAINWGLVGFFDFDLIAFLFGDMTTLTRILYSLIGLSGIYQLVVSTKTEAEMERGTVH
ncbi:MAG: DUF378 domain-containing protein [Candidatus Gastranaerophilales bacterium]|jgi:uncharacterized membrane protein YuzA (DUF378 family)|nr:DUF378 domain-containing protein [Candidatus Gastranaerophilales bacterium]